MSNTTTRPLSFALQTVVWAVAFVAAVAPGSADAASQENPAVVGSAGGQGAGLEAELAARLAALEADASLDDATREQRKALIDEALAALARADAHTERAAALEASTEVESAEADRLRALLAEPLAAPEPPADAGTEPSTSDGDESLEALEQRATQRAAQVAALRAAMVEYEQSLAFERDRIEAAPAELSEARVELEQLEAATTRTEVIDALGELEQLRDRARRRELAALASMLTQELASQPARIARLDAQVEVARRAVDEAEARSASARDALNERRKDDAEDASDRADEQNRAARGKHEQIVELADYIAGIADSVERTLDRTIALNKELDEVSARLKVRVRDSTEIKDSLDLGITRNLGDVLVELRRDLKDPRGVEREADALRAEAMQQRLELFKLERDIVRLKDTEAVLDERMKRPSVSAEMTPAERAALRAELAVLLGDRLTQSRSLEQPQRDLLVALGALEQRKRLLAAEVSRLIAVLDEHLLWIPNMDPVHRASGAIADDLVWLFDLDRDPQKVPGQWSRALGAIRRDLAPALHLYALASVVIFALLALRRRALVALRAIAADVGKVRKDGILLTVRAIFLHLAVALPQPLGIAFIGWRLETAALTDNSTRAIGSALLSTSLVALALIYAREAARADGLVRGHFGWSDRVGKLFRRHLGWFTPAALAATFLIALTAQQPPVAARTALSALALIALCGLIAAFGGCLLGRRRGVAAGASSSLVRGTRAWWLPIAVVLPVALAIMAAAGYQYAALVLAERLQMTVLVILSTILLHSFLFRWLTVSQSRLALKVAMDKRAALIERREAGDAPSEVEGLPEAIDEIDVAEIADQTKDLLRIAIGFLLAVGLWVTWLDTLPALSVLDVPLWSHVVEGIAEPVPITVGSLVLGFLIVAITAMAARNAPGLLEIILLQRLPLDSGARYAARTLTLYTIVATGIVLAFNTIGVDWSSIQWLVAALTVGLGFGLQEIFANFVSGLIILLERPVRVGDTVTVSDTTGVVTRIRMRATTITDWQRRELVVPNRNFITGELINWSLSDPILRLDFVVGIAYGSDTSLAQKVMLEVARNHPMVLPQPESNVFFIGFGDSTLNFEVRVFVNEPTNVARTRIKHDLHMAIDQACREHGIEIAFPQRDIHMRPSDGVLRVSLEGPLAEVAGGAEPIEPTKSED